MSSKSNRQVPLLPKGPIPGAGGGGYISRGNSGEKRPPDDNPHPRRKRTTVAIACENCRRKKVRCGGERPRCNRCLAASEDCVYEFAAGSTSRSAARREAGEHLLHENRELREFLSHVRNQPLADAQGLLQRLRNSEDPLELLDRIRQAELLLHGDSSKPLGVAQEACISQRSTDNKHSAYRATALDEASRAGVSTSAEAPMGGTANFFRRQLSSKFDHPEHMFEETWLNSRDMFAEPDAFIELRVMICLYRSGLLYRNRIIDRTMFEEDMRTLDPSANHDGELVFCSPLLINALLALSCFYTTNSATYFEPGDNTTRGAAFAKEALRLLPLEQSSDSLTVTQALVFMSIYEGEFGTVANFMEYIDRYCDHYSRLYLHERLKNQPRASDPRVSQALSWIDWGFHVFEWKFALPLNRRKSIRKPPSPKPWQIGEPSLSQESSPDYWWYAYPVSVLPQRSYKREIFAAECALVEIIEDVLDFLIPLDDNRTPSDDPQTALMLYKRLIDWKYSLPECLHVEKVMVPTAIMLHAYLDDVIIALLRPYDKLIAAQFDGIEPNTTSLSHASNLVGTIWTYRALYIVRQEFWLTHLLAICAFRVLFDLHMGPIHMDTFVKACQGLHELSERFRIARDVLNSLQVIVQQRNIQLPQFAARHFTSKTEGLPPSVMRYTVVPVHLRPSSDGESVGEGVRHYKISDIIMTSSADIIVD